MEEDNPVKKLTFQKPFGSRRKGRQKLRWIDDVETHLVEKKGVGQRRIKGYVGGGQDLKKAVAPLMMMMMMMDYINNIIRPLGHIYSNNYPCRVCHLFYVNPDVRCQALDPLLLLRQAIATYIRRAVCRSQEGRAVRGSCGVTGVRGRVNSDWSFVTTRQPLTQ
jgi:hypothetical protein